MIIPTHNDDSLNRSWVFEWFSRFQAGRQMSESNESSGCTYSIGNKKNVHRMQMLVTSGHHLCLVHFTNISSNSFWNEYAVWGPICWTLKIDAHCMTTDWLTSLTLSSGYWQVSILSVYQPPTLMSITFLWTTFNFRSWNWS